MVFKVLFAILIGIIAGIGLEYWIFYLTDGLNWIGSFERLFDSGLLCSLSNVGIGTT